MPETIQKMIPHSLLKDLLVGTHVTEQPELLQALKKEFNYDFNQARTEIDLETYVRIMDYLRRNLYPSRPAAEGYFQLGLLSLEGHFQSSIGKINKVATRMFRMEKAAELYLKTQRFNYPFGQHELLMLGKGQMSYRRSNVPTPPDFTRGVLSYLVQLTGGKNVKVWHQVTGPETVVYEVRWE